MQITSFTQVLAFSCVASQVLAINPGQLGLKIYAPLATNGKYVYNAIAQFEDDVQDKWTDEQIVGIAKQAFEDIQAAYNADLKTHKALVKSWATSVIVKGHSVYISSTLSGGGSFLYIPNANTDNRNLKYIPGNINQAADAGVLEWALMQCQVASTSGAGHRTGANCGEMMAAMAFVQTNPLGVLDNSPVVTWGKYKELDDQGRRTGPYIFGVMDPCRIAQGLGKAPEYGCAQVSAKLGMRAIRSGTATQDTVLSHNPTVTYPCFD